MNAKSARMKSLMDKDKKVAKGGQVSDATSEKGRDRKCTRSRFVSDTENDYRQKYDRMGGLK